MSKFRFVLNKDGVSELMKSQEMQAILETAGSQKASQAGLGYESEVHVFKKRAVAHVFPGDAESAHDNYENNTLVKVIGGGG